MNTENNPSIQMVIWIATQIRSLAHCQPFVKISCKSVWKFCAKLLIDKQTNKQQRLHILFGGGKSC